MKEMKREKRTLKRKLANIFRPLQDKAIYQVVIFLLFCCCCCFSCSDCVVEKLIKYVHGLDLHQTLYCKWCFNGTKQNIQNQLESATITICLKMTRCNMFNAEDTTRYAITNAHKYVPSC